MMLFIIQVVVNVQDGGVPPLSASTTVTIRVIRNTAPFFPAPKTTTATIPNTRSPGSEVITYTATDNDASVKYLLQITLINALFFIYNPVHVYDNECFDLFLYLARV